MRRPVVTHLESIPTPTRFAALNNGYTAGSDAVKPECDPLDDLGR
jgi:hypothetical protein